MRKGLSQLYLVCLEDYYITLVVSYDSIFRLLYIFGYSQNTVVQYFAYIEITTGEAQNLWREYLGVKESCKNFAMQRIEGITDIYPVFRELFKKKLA